MTPWLSDPDVTLYHGDVLATLRELPAESVDCVVTSPPYWGLRDYGTAEWEGGDTECDHRKREPARTDSVTLVGTSNAEGYAMDTYRDTCGKCGATRIDQQLGLEPTPEQYVERMVEVFREVRRVLAAHGTVWLNLGDSYATSPTGSYGTKSGLNGAQTSEKYAETIREQYTKRKNTIVSGLKPKDLVGIPWRVAFALQTDGWWLRSDIIWAKPNPMPESMTDRPTKAHEYVFLLSKQPRYFFDQEAVREAHHHDGRAVTMVQGQNGSIQHRDGERWPNAGRNIRSVWEIATQPYPEAHFATFPEELARRSIAAGCPEQVCRVCDVPRTRIVDVSYEKSPVHGSGSVVGRHYETGANNFDGAGMPRVSKVTETRGFTDCGHADYRPGIVLDPFMGSGTTAFVARKLGRHAVGIDLNAEYLALAARRLQQQSLFAEVV